MRRSAAVAILAVAAVAEPPLAGRELVAGTERHVAADPDGHAMVEPHLAVDPANPSHLPVGVIVISTDMTDSDCATLLSLDGGETWTRGDLGVSSCADPWGAILDDGSAIMTVLAARPAEDPADDAPVELLVYRDGSLYIVSLRDVRREGPYARTPALALGPDGAVGVSFFHGRGSGSFMHIFRCQRTYFTASLDGGESWIPEVAVSGEPSCPIGPRSGTAGMRFPAGGDYHGLAALPDGSFRIVWSDARSGVFEPWTNTVRIEP